MMREKEDCDINFDDEIIAEKVDDNARKETRYMNMYMF